MPSAGTLPGELTSSEIVRICGQDELLAADVSTELGKNALQVSQPCIKSTITNAKIVVGVTAVELKVAGSRLTNRQSLTVQPVTGKIYIGGSGVTTSTGLELSNKQIYEVAIQDVPLYAIAASNVDAIVLEGA